MTYVLTEGQLRHLLEDAAELGALAALTKTGRTRPYLKKSQAFRKYGRSRVERWIGHRLVTLRKDGDHSAAWRIDHIEIAAVLKAAGHHLDHA